MRVLVAAAAVALAVSLTACGGDDEPQTGTGSDPVVTSEEPAPVTSEPAPSEETESEPATPGDVPVLTGVVGTEANPDEFSITLVDDTGAPVTEIPAGDYQIVVSDLSAMHNFHLTGTGVEESTTVEEIADATWDVTFEAGEYTYKCDPHPPMTGSLTVV